MVLCLFLVPPVLAIPSYIAPSTVCRSCPVAQSRHNTVSLKASDPFWPLFAISTVEFVRSADRKTLRMCASWRFALRHHVTVQSSSPFSKPSSGVRRVSDVFVQCPYFGSLSRLLTPCSNKSTTHTAIKMDSVYRTLTHVSCVTTTGPVLGHLLQSGPHWFFSPAGFSPSSLNAHLTLVLRLLASASARGKPGQILQISALCADSQPPPVPLIHQNWL